MTTTKKRFFDTFNDFGTNTTGSWEILQTGAGMAITGPLGGAAAGSSPYLKITSGTTVGKTCLLSKVDFTMPVQLRYQITASQRIANNRCLVGFVQVDGDGAIITDTTHATAVEVLNSRNAVFHQHDGTVATTGQLRVRGGGSALDTFANAFGTGFTTIATGSEPNFLCPTTHMMTVETDKINSRCIGQNVLTNTGVQFSYDRVLINPTVRYKLCIIVENDGVPATSTDWRLHMVSVTDASRLEISPRNAGSTDQHKAFPVIAHITGGTITNAGTPAAPATPYILNSAATTNGALIITGTSGLHAFYATNTGETPAFVKLYNKATAPTVGTDVPAMIIPIPAAVAGVPGVANLFTGHNAFRFLLGLGIAITGAVADNDTTAVAAGQVKVMLSRTA